MKGVFVGLITLVWVFGWVEVECYDGSREGDKIVALPGQPPVKFSQYSGYVTVDPTAGRSLFYYFTEAEKPSDKPLVLWLNGGPGCSSLGGGAMKELGPFRVNPDGKTLRYNEYAWNTLANILFLESPAGVGFSYSNTTSDYVTGDNKTAADSYTFLVKWLERFPEYKTRDFYLTGESYAGHYAPQLAQQILNNNKLTNQTKINLKGIAIGNAYIDRADLLRGTYDFLWAHALMSDEHHNAIFKHCNFSASSSPTSKKCKKAMDAGHADAGKIFIYDVYAPICDLNSSSPSTTPYDPCSSHYVKAYLNTPQVQTAFHANRPWENCNDVISHNWNDNPRTVLPLIKEIMTTGNVSFWLFSGDTDGKVPVTATRYSLTKLGATVKTPWYPWYYNNHREVGGYAVEYSENLTFVTIRGAGHFVPSYQPQRALAFFSSFLNGKLPPTTHKNA